MTITTTITSRTSATTRDKIQLNASILKKLPIGDANAAQVMYSAFLSYAHI